MDEPSGVRPMRVYDIVKRADSAAMTRSPAQMRLRPAPPALPLTTAITSGARIREKRFIAVCRYIVTRFKCAGSSRRDSGPRTI